MLNFKRTKNLNTFKKKKYEFLNWLWKNFIDFSNTIRISVKYLILNKNSIYLSARSLTTLYVLSYASDDI